MPAPPGTRRRPAARTAGRRTGSASSTRQAVPRRGRAPDQRSARVALLVGHHADRRQAFASGGWACGACALLPAARWLRGGRQSRAAIVSPKKVARPPYRRSDDRLKKVRIPVCRSGLLCAPDCEPLSPLRKAQRRPIGGDWTPSGEQLLLALRRDAGAQLLAALLRKRFSRRTGVARESRRRSGTAGRRVSPSCSRCAEPARRARPDGHGPPRPGLCSSRKFSVPR